MPVIRRRPATNFEAMVQAQRRGDWLAKAVGEKRDEAGDEPLKPGDLPLAVYEIGVNGDRSPAGIGHP